MLLHRSLSAHAIALASGKKASQYFISWSDNKGKRFKTFIDEKILKYAKFKSRMYHIIHGTNESYLLLRMY